MKKHYDGLSAMMSAEYSTISAAMSHAGERGRNNELIITEFLKTHLAMRYTVSTGKVISADGGESGQIDLIVHDRLNTPGFVETHAWKLVPVETVYAVISVKTTLDRSELEDAMKSVATARNLSRKAATAQMGPHFVPISEEQVLRPRAFVFAFKSRWSDANSVENAFRELLETFDDDLRPNAICVLDQCFISRRPYKTETRLFAENALMHFFVFLCKTIDSFPRYNIALSKYFREDYGQ